MLSKQTILEALQSLSDRLSDRDEHVELLLVGGAAIVLLYEARPSTRDVDVVRIDGGDASRLREASHEVAVDLNLPEDWLNDAVKGYVHGVDAGTEIFRGSHLRVRSASAQQLLAMKLSAWRDDVDIADAALLLRQIQGSADDLWKQLGPFLVPGRELKAQLAFRDLWEAAHASE